VDYFERASRSPGFWSTRKLAEESARHADEGRTLLDTFDGLVQQTNAIEDLAFEAWHQRQSSSLRALEEELTAARTKFEPLRELLYATQFRTRGAAVLYAVPGNAAGAQAAWLARTYLAWCQSRSLPCALFAAERKPARERTRTQSIPPESAWEWRAIDPDDLPHSLGPFALTVTGNIAPTLLSSEQGSHRFHVGSQTALVRVAYVPLRTALQRESELTAVEKLEPLSEVDIRRIWIDKRFLRDLRTGKDHPITDKRGDLGPVLAELIEQKVFGAEAEPWK
jgi:hypothetical protein